MGRDYKFDRGIHISLSNDNLIEEGLHFFEIR